jgi:hypothetical protein
MATLEAWLDEQISTHNLRVSPRLSVQERLTHFLERWAVKQGHTLDAEDIDLAAMLVSLRFSEIRDADVILNHFKTEGSYDSAAAAAAPSSSLRRSRRLQ